MTARAASPQSAAEYTHAALGRRGIPPFSAAWTAGTRTFSRFFLTYVGAHPFQAHTLHSQYAQPLSIYKYYWYTLHPLSHWLSANISLSHTHRQYSSSTSIPLLLYTRTSYVFGSLRAP